MKVSDILTRAQDILQDENADYWSQGELLRWLNDGRLDAYKARPDLYEASDTVTLDEGYRQTIPNGSRRLFSVPRNISAPRQRAITLIRANDLARVRPNWRSDPKAVEVRHYMYDEFYPDHFDVYPPVRENVEVEVRYAKLPDVVSNVNTELEQEGEYATALIDFVLYRAFLKEADTVPAFHARAMQHFQVATATLTGDTAVKAATSPNANG